MSHLIVKLCRNQILNQINYARVGLFNSHLNKIDSMKSVTNVHSTCTTAKKQVNLSKNCLSIVNQLKNELNTNQKLNKRANYLLDEIDKVCEEIKELEELNCEDEIEFKELASDDLKNLSSRFDKLKNDLYDLLCAETYLTDELMMEFENGVGGNEAMIFTKEMVNFYTQFCKSQGWLVEIVESEISNDVDGYLKCFLKISGKDCFKLLRYEAGVHRVQRIPTTDKMNRIHTSTIAIKVIPIFGEVEIDLSPKNISIETMRSTGPGGMNVNKRETAVRILHLPSNIAIRCDKYRTQEENAKLAMEKLKIELSDKRYRELRENEDRIRSNQVKSLLRSEKIRTFNFSQDRITDHRIRRDLSNLKGFFAGTCNENLMEWIEDMNEQHNRALRNELTDKFDLEK